MLTFFVNNVAGVMPCVMVLGAL